MSNLATGEPLWIGFGRSAGTLREIRSPLSPEQKARIRLFSRDMHQAIDNAVRGDEAVDHAPLVHAPFHVRKRATEARDELRRESFSRAGG